MKTYDKDEIKKVLYKIKEWGLLSGILFITLGEIIIDNWGTSTREGQQYWYAVQYEVINVVGVIGVIMCFIGIFSFIAWLLSLIILNISIPCPKCGGLLIQHSEICPYCKIKLDWGYSISNSVNKQPKNQRMQYCSICGKKIGDDAAFCINCGKKVN